MSNYTTGEIAKLCGVSVRTVQYYDSRGILVPSAISGGGRRLYSEEDLGRMKVICFLRELDLPIKTIKAFLEEENVEEVLSLLLEEQEKKLQSEIAERQLRLDKLNRLKRIRRKIEPFSIESFRDIAHIMENRTKLRRVHLKMIAVGIVMDIVEIGTLVLWIREGIWQPFVCGICVVLATAVWISSFYFKRVAYICPSCHTVFKPGFKEAFLAGHTPNTRKLTCTACGYHGFCIETYGLEGENNE